jgi:hypothetical protein
MTDARRFRFVREAMARKDRVEQGTIIALALAIGAYLWAMGAFSSPLHAWASRSAAILIGWRAWRVYSDESRSWREYGSMRLWLEDGHLHMANDEKQVAHPLRQVSRVRPFARRGRLTRLTLEYAGGAFREFVGLDDMDGFLAELRKQAPWIEYENVRNEGW